MVEELAEHLLANKPATLEEAFGQKMSNGSTVEEFIKAGIAKIGEKLSLRRFRILTKTDNDAFGAYVHMGGRIGVIVRA